ncbi:hypothetical protein PC119_g3122 [Phytophthora cactorum]|nr:hypothetical protein PC111_g5998 [Phytophthora cactorum]KAG3016876.1 hypothetical protein PC120_g11380 [Phytophthora cactorum]KAG3038094.1 hypothetical protein PC119_g3122 [Phytophthora cactorum]KAG3179011.1 hypothetical protein C6341_g7749 [Phytophthora cactorum]
MELVLPGSQQRIVRRPDTDIRPVGSIPVPPEKTEEDNCMGKRKTREPEAPFIQNTELLTRNHEDLDKLRLDLWSTTVKQLKIVKLIRNEIPDCKDSDARNVVHDTSELLKKRIEQIQEILEGSLDHSIQRYKKRRL